MLRYSGRLHLHFNCYFFKEYPQYLSISALYTSKAISHGPIESSLLGKLQTHFKPLKLVIDNESPTHASHAAMKDVQDKSETHFS